MLARLRTEPVEILELTASQRAQFVRAVAPLVPDGWVKCPASTPGTAVMVVFMSRPLPWSGGVPPP